MPKKRKSPMPAGDGAAVLEDGQRFHYTSTSTAAQRERAVKLLRHGPKTSHDLRQAGIYWPPARIRELRKAGYDIRTTFVTLWDHLGFPHRGCALYTLHGEPEGQP